MVWLAVNQTDPAGGSSKTATRRLKQAGHMSRDSSLEREVRPPRENERVEVKLLPIVAFAYPFHAVARAMGASHVDFPTQPSRGYGLDRNENK
jgi:hypothetical protein